MNELKVGDVVSMSDGDTWVCFKLDKEELYHVLNQKTDGTGMQIELGIHPSLIPEGFAIVPIEPDANILLSLCDLTWDLHNISSNRMDFIRDMYKAMVNAAPKQTDK